MDLIITILPVVTKHLPISPRFTPYDFLSRYKFSILTTCQPMVEFYLLTFPRFPLRKKEHKSYFGKNRTHDFRTSRCAGYLLEHSGDGIRKQMAQKPQTLVLGLTHFWDTTHPIARTLFIKLTRLFRRTGKSRKRSIQYLLFLAPNPSRSIGRYFTKQKVVEIWSWCLWAQTGCFRTNTWLKIRLVVIYQINAPFSTY